MTDEERKNLVGCGTLVAGLALLAPSIAWNAYVLAHLWNWFATPFTPVRLSLPMAVGLSCLIRKLKGLRYDPDNWTNAQRINSFIFGFTAPGFLLLIGAIAHHYAVAAK